MSDTKYRVAIIGCGRMGQNYAEAYTTYPDTEIVAIVDANAQRREVLGARFGVNALYADVETLLRDIVPDIAVVVTPTKYMKDAVIACAEAGVKGISTEKPIAARLQDADAMVDACAERGVVFAGGNLQRAMNEVQEAASRLHNGEFGDIKGASVHGFGGEISGGGCQHISVLRLFMNAEVEEIIAYGTPPEALSAETDEGLIINGRFRLTNGLECSVFGTPTPCRGVDVWTDECLIRWDWNPPEIFKGYDPRGNRIQIEPNYSPYPWHEFSYLTGSIRSFLAAVDGNGHPWITGADLRQALEVAIAAKRSATLNSAPVKLPLEDRSLALYPRPYRWLGGDATGRPQSIEEAQSSHTSCAENSKHAPCVVTGVPPMNEDQKYLFDLTGFLIVENALTPEEVAQCNAAIDHHIDGLRERENSLAGGSPALVGTANRMDMGGMLAWEKPWCEPFRNLLVHPSVKPYLEEVLGKKYRLDHGPGLIAMEKGTEGGTLHGGGIERPNFSETYFFKYGRIYTGLTVIEYMLADEGPGDGGLAIIPGSHKANLPCPSNMRRYEEYQHLVLEVNAKAGDAVIFTETLTHGTLPWKGDHQRRALLYKFSPGFQAYSAGAHQITYPDYIEDMSPEQREVMEAPHIRH